MITKKSRSKRDFLILILLILRINHLLGFFTVNGITINNIQLFIIFWLIIYVQDDLNVFYCIL